MTTIEPSPSAPAAPSLQVIVSDALRYWELRRLVYNAVLAAIVVYYYIAGLPLSRQALTFELAKGLFILMVLANLFYCAAYPADVFVQLSGFRSLWLRWRWALLLLGMVLGSIFTQMVAEGMFFPFDRG